MKKNLIYGGLLISALMLAGCSKATEAPVIVVDDSTDEMAYTLVAAAIDDVILTDKMKCTYVQTSDQEVFFDVTGKYVDKVYVKEGETVKKGDLLCELSSGYLEDEIETLEYNIARNELTLTFLDNKELLDKQDVWLLGLSADDAKEKISIVEEKYNKERVAVNDALEFDRLELNKRQKELKASRLYASIDGIIYSLKDNLEGSTSKADTVIMKIVDNTDCLFETDQLQFKEYIEKDQIIDMNSVYSSAAGDYQLIPYDYDNWTDKMLFSVYSGPDSAVIDVGTQGTVIIELDRKENVLCLPKETIHFADGESYVYILNEDNMREVKWVETGLIGDTAIEILSGLKEGDKVVRR